MEAVLEKFQVQQINLSKESPTFERESHPD
jgi:hypothetical protein